MTSLLVGRKVVIKDSMFFPKWEGIIVKVSAREAKALVRRLDNEAIEVLFHSQTPRLGSRRPPKYIPDNLVFYLEPNKWDISDWFNTPNPDAKKKEVDNG